jgi:hypothetical protein
MAADQRGHVRAAWGARRLPGQQGLQVRKDARIGQGPPGEHDPGRAGLGQAGRAVRRRPQVAAGHDRDRTRRTSRAMAVQSDRPAYPWVANRGCRVSQSAPASTRRGPISRQTGRGGLVPRRSLTPTMGEASAGPAWPRRPWPGSWPRAGPGRPKRGPGPGLGHLGHRAPGVEVEMPNTPRREPGHGPGRIVRFGTEDLGTRGASPGQVATSRRCPGREKKPLGADHFGHGRGAAVFPAQHPEGQVG